MRYLVGESADAVRAVFLQDNVTIKVDTQDGSSVSFAVRSKGFKVANSTLEACVAELLLTATERALNARRLSGDVECALSGNPAVASAWLLLAEPSHCMPSGVDPKPVTLLLLSGHRSSSQRTFNAAQNARKVH